MITLTESPTIYVSLIEQFWQTASASTLENGDMEITATIDGKVKLALIGISNDEDNQEDPSKQGRKIAQIDEDEGITSRYTDMKLITIQPALKLKLIQKVYVEVAEEEPSKRKDKELINERKRKFAQQRAEQRRNKPMTQAQQRTYMCNYIKHMGSRTLQKLKKLSFDEIKELFETTMKRVNTFTPMESDDTVPKVVAGSSKSDAKQELNQESSKRQKIGEGSEPAEESKDELSQEQLQQLMIIVPEEGMNVEVLQIKYPIID
ncbi:hypothetical protein Tco_1571268 [Tanacetum coccineum]